MKANSKTRKNPVNVAQTGDVVTAILNNVNSRHNDLANKLLGMNGSSAVTDFAEYRYLLGVFHGITQMKNETTEIIKALENSQDDYLEDAFADADNA